MISRRCLIWATYPSGFMRRPLGLLNQMVLAGRLLLFFHHYHQCIPLFQISEKSLDSSDMEAENGRMLFPFLSLPFIYIHSRHFSPRPQ